MKRRFSRLVSGALAVSMVFGSAQLSWAAQEEVSTQDSSAAVETYVEEVLSQNEEEETSSAEESVAEESAQARAEEEALSLQSEESAEQVSELPQEEKAEEPQSDEAEVQEGEEEAADEEPLLVLSEEDDPNYYSPVVELTPGEDNGYENYNILSEALGRADGVHSLTVRIANPGTYYLSSSGGSLMMRSNTTLDLNGSTLIRSGSMYNLMQNCTLGGERSVGGYTATENVTVLNGGLDGSGNNQPEKNLVNLGHASGFTFRNVSFSHCQGSHLMELNGCRDCLVENCTFSGYQQYKKHFPEAIQLDISYNGAGEDWNGVYCVADTDGADNTVCQNITVRGCTFLDYPAGVGNHHCLYGGPRSSGIKILNNTFANTVKYGKVNDFEPPAVWCYGLDNSEVSGNIITGVYQCGVRFSGGSVKVKNNKIGTKKKPVNYPPIYVTEANSYVKNQKSARKAESVTGGCVEGNTIYTTYSKSNRGAVTVYGKSKLSSISKNKITSAKGGGIVVGSGSTVKKINSNTVYSAGKSGIYLSQCTVNAVNTNTVSNCAKSGIEATSSAKVTQVKSNKLKACNKFGIRISGKKVKVTVQKNQLNGTKLSVSAKGNVQKQ